jgi:hypothetical protein
MASSISSSSLPQPNYHPHVKYTPATVAGQPAVNIPLLRELIRTVVCCASTPIPLASLARPPTSVIKAAHTFNGDVFFCCMRTQLSHTRSLMLITCNPAYNCLLAGPCSVAAIHSAGECEGVGDDALINHARKKDVVNITNSTHAL